MPTERLVAAWEVNAGVVPMTPEKEYSKKWFYTHSDKEKDLARSEGDKTESIFVRNMREAHEYAESITNPKYINWVQVTFLWL